MRAFLRLKILTSFNLTFNLDLFKDQIVRGETSYKNLYGLDVDYAVDNSDPIFHRLRIVRHFANPDEVGIDNNESRPSLDLKILPNQSFSHNVYFIKLLFVFTINQEAK